MNLYDRDFSVPSTQEEIDALKEEIQWQNMPGIKYANKAPHFAHPNPDIRNFLMHSISFFPNNYLNPITVMNLDLESECTQFITALNSAINESAIQTYIKSNRKWFIPASLFIDYNFGHHVAYLFPEQQLGAEYQADYMLLGKNSDGYSIVLVEYEDVNVDYKISTSNTESAAVRKGLTQIKDWKRWFDNNKTYFFKSCGFEQHGIIIPSSRILYALVVSRRSKMDATCKEMRSQSMYETPNLKILSYDRLADNISRLSLGY